MTLHLTAGDLAAIRAHAARSYPDECCGFLVGSYRRGRSGHGEDGHVAFVRAEDNEREENRQRRFLIHPETYRAVEREAAAAGLAILGTYHSHPDHPAEPSAYDRDHAWPGWSYLIVSVEAGEPTAARSYRLRDDRSAFDEETVAAAEKVESDDLPKEPSS